MIINKTRLTISIIFFISINIYSQDFIRIGLAHDFQENKIVQTFSFDLNRTEKIDEKAGKFLLYNKKNFYILPSSDINIGEGVTSSENNVLFQINIGKKFLGKLLKSKDNLRTSAWNKAIEFNPSYNSDKLFQEKLSYGQLKLLLNFISQKHSDKTDSTYIKSVHSIALGGFSNLGYRYSKINKTDDLYSTAGILFDYKTRLLDSENIENWIFKITGNYYYIISDVQQLTSDNFAGLIKSSVDKYVYKNIFVGLVYKYGNDNPNYNYIQTLELSVKLKY